MRLDRRGRNTRKEATVAKWVDSPGDTKLESPGYSGKVMNMRLSARAGMLVAVLLLQTLALHAAERRSLPNHVPSAVAGGSVTPTGRLPRSNRMDVAIGLPLRDPEGLKNLLSQIYNPDSPEYRHYLSPQQFTAGFGPTEEDYQAVIAFVESSGLTVKSTTPNRMLVDVSGSVGDIERAFQVTMRVYHDPNANREFHAPDVRAVRPGEHSSTRDHGPGRLRATPSCGLEGQAA